MSRNATVLRDSERYAIENYEAAAIIAADPIKYPPGSGLAQFARAVLAKSRPPVKRGVQNVLFEEEA